MHYFQQCRCPGGIPVATMSIGKGGAKNAGIFAAQILSVKYPEIKERLVKYREDMVKAVEDKNSKLNLKLKSK